MTKTYRRFSTAFKLQLVEAYLAGDGSLKVLATRGGLDHSLLHYRVAKYRAGELSLDVAREETLVESEQKIEALDTEGGPADNEAGALEKGAHRRPRDKQCALVDHLRSHGVSAARGCRMIGLPRSTYYHRAVAAPVHPPSSPHDDVLVT